MVVVVNAAILGWWFLFVPNVLNADTWLAVTNNVVATSSKLIVTFGIFIRFYQCFVWMQYNCLCVVIKKRMLNLCANLDDPSTPSRFIHPFGVVVCVS